MTANMNVTLTQNEISILDVLWQFYVLQSNKVKEAFRLKLETANLAENNITESQQKMVKESFTRAYEELLAGKVKHNARSLFLN